MQHCKNILSVLFCVFAFCLVAFAYTEEQLDAAHVLFDVGMMKGNSDAFSAEGMNLDSYTTRAELAVTVTRLLGKEQKAKYQQNPHPFGDVPDWASDCVGYLYENYLVNGVSDTLFGSEEQASVKQFCTMLLRVLGYDDAAGDFAYDDAPRFAKEIGFLPRTVADEGALLRGDMMVSCLAALRSNRKRSSSTLAEKLLHERIFDTATFNRLGGGEDRALEKYFSAVPDTLCKLQVLRDDKERIVLIPSVMLGDYGLRVFYTSDTQKFPAELARYAPGAENAPSFQKGASYYPDNSGAGYVKELYVYGLSDETNVRLSVVSTSSEGEAYVMQSRSAIVSVLDDTVTKDLLSERFADVPETASFALVNDYLDAVELVFADKVGEYGIHVFYTSSDELIPVEITQNGSIRFAKGEPIYVSYDPATYIDSLTVYGLENKKNVRLMVLFASSESALYVTYGRSEIVSLPR